MQILRISTRNFPDIGGPAKQAYLLSKYCSKNKIKTINIACKSKSNSFFKNKKINDNFEIYYLPFQAPRINARLITRIFFFFKFVIYGFLKANKIRKTFKIDLIHAHSPLPSGFIAYFFSKIFKIPYIYSIHGTDYPYSFLFNLDINLIAYNSKKTILMSRKIVNFLNKKYKLKNLCWMPNAIENSEYFHVSTEAERKVLIESLNLDLFLKTDDKVILYIGYMIFLQKVSGMIDFLIAFQNFLKNLKEKKKSEKFKLVFIGEGKYADLLKKKIREFNLEENVIFLGKRDDIKDFLAIADLLALTSYVEGSPNVILEAMASNVPCLGTNVGEIKNIIGNTGYIVNPGDIVNIEKNLVNFFNLSKIQRSELMEKAKKKILNQFDINVIGKKWIKLYSH